LPLANPFDPGRYADRKRHSNVRSRPEIRWVADTYKVYKSANRKNDEKDAKTGVLWTKKQRFSCCRVRIRAKQTLIFSYFLLFSLVLLEKPLPMLGEPPPMLGDPLVLLE
jgi:hypothetical protein